MSKVESTFYSRIGRHLGHTEQGGTYGLEIETESRSPYTVPSIQGWMATTDGSLRNFGIEYILERPVPFEEISKVLKNFRDATEGINFLETFTTSVHVHVNMQKETIRTLGNMSVIVTLLENLMLRYSGETRRSNAFCLGQSDAEVINVQICRYFEDIERKRHASISNVTDHNAKYAAMNFASLSRRGSLEFRSFRGTVDIDEIQEWVEIINSILTYSRSDICPEIILERYHSEGVEYLSKIFSQKLWNNLYSGPQDNEMIEANEFLAASIVDSISDWRGLVEASGKKFPLEMLEKEAETLFSKTLDQLSQGEAEELFQNLLREEEVFEGSYVSNLVDSIFPEDPVDIHPSDNWRTQPDVQPLGDRFGGSWADLVANSVTIR